MSTRSDIIVHRADGKWARIYCHSDGYISHHGPILLENYNSQERAEALVAPGDISVLSVSGDRPDGHSFASPVDGFTVYYGRDRGEIDVEARISDTLKEALGDDLNEYTYVWDNGAWAVQRGFNPESSQSLATAKEALA